MTVVHGWVSETAAPNERGFGRTSLHSAPTKNLSHSSQRFFGGVLPHGASTAQTRHATRLSRKLCDSLWHRLAEAPALLLACGHATLVTATAERTAEWIEL